MKTIFVTGATGYLGMHFLRAAAEAPWTLRCLARSRPPHEQRNVEWVTGDLLSDSWYNALSGCDGIVHLATVPLGDCERDPQRGERVIVEGYRRLLDAALDRGVSRVWGASTSEVYGNARLPIAEDAPLQPESLYGYYKACADVYTAYRCIEHSVAYCILRFSTLYGVAIGKEMPRIVVRIFAERISRGEGVVLHAGVQNSRDFLHVSDAARALVLAIERPDATGVINVGSGRETRLADVATQLARICKVPLQMDVRGDEGRIRRARLATSRARSALGFRPRVTLSRGLREVVRAVQS
ncbi:MAG: NAD(P)-dependent oxidoreductase [Candidatus Eremiobacteraeota bacterium]|nr:NAD(P)-dependent oxidoreductase [Candidatus Eremiobacteraeota bacterium]